MTAVPHRCVLTVGVAAPLAGAVVAAAAGSAASLAAGPVTGEPLRALVIVLGSACSGAAVLLIWVPDRARRTWRVMAAAAAAWFVCACAEFLVRAADIVGVEVMAVTDTEIGRLLRDTTLGQWGWVGVVCPLVLLVVSLDAARGGTGWHPGIPAALAGIGVIAGPVTGHLTLAGGGQFVIAAHVLAAAAWFGPLGTAPFVLRTSEQWTRFLARFTHLAFICVAVLLGSGVIATVLRLRTSAVTELWWILLIVKIVGVNVVIALGWRHRKTWVDVRVPVSTSVRRAITETTLLAGLVGVAAALAHTP